jgi:hypothetical protein
MSAQTACICYTTIDFVTLGPQGTSAEVDHADSAVRSLERDADSTSLAIAPPSRTSPQRWTSYTGDVGILTLFGVVCVSLMLVAYALEERGGGFVMLFAVWTIVAIRRWRRRVRDDESHVAVCGQCSNMMSK